MGAPGTSHVVIKLLESLFALGPSELFAVTLRVYCVPGVRFVIVILLALGFNTSFLILPGNAIAVYPIIGESP